MTPHGSRTPASRPARRCPELALASSRRRNREGSWSRARLDDQHRGLHRRFSLPTTRQARDPSRRIERELCHHPRNLPSARTGGQTTCRSSHGTLPLAGTRPVRRRDGGRGDTMQDPNNTAVCIALADIQNRQPGDERASKRAAWRSVRPRRPSSLFATARKKLAKAVSALCRRSLKVSVCDCRPVAFFGSQTTLRLGAAMTIMLIDPGVALINLAVKEVAVGSPSPPITWRLTTRRSAMAPVSCPNTGAAWAARGGERRPCVQMVRPLQS